jgi:hypothetical protein
LGEFWTPSRWGSQHNYDVSRLHGREGGEK